jgi:putative DNA primase/helicase
MTMMGGCQYIEGAQCPHWNIFIHEITCGIKALAAYLRRLAGYCLTGDTSEQTYFIFYGKGQNGKSTFLRVLTAILGDYATYAKFRTFAAEGSDAAGRDELARLRGKRLVVAIEVKKRQRLNESLLREVTGGEELVGHFLYHPEFTYQPQFKVILGVNDLPKIEGTDMATWRRPHLVPFNYTVPPEKLIRDLFEAYLRPEFPGILNWMLEGCKEWQRLGLAPPEVVTEATGEYRRSMDTVERFLRECCDVDPKDRLGDPSFLRAATAFRTYQNFQKGEGGLNRRDFYEEMDTLFKTNNRSQCGYKVWRGLALKGGLLTEQ